MQFEREISSKTELEHYMKKAVAKVNKERKRAKDEANKNRVNSAKFYITALDSTPSANAMQGDNNELS
jgi:hypothetical protein